MDILSSYSTTVFCQKCYKNVNKYAPKKEAFPGAICISVNDELVHGAPKNEPFEEGDKVSFDLDIFYKGYFTDSAFTMIVGSKGNPAVKKMISVTESANSAGKKFSSTGILRRWRTVHLSAPLRR